MLVLLVNEKIYRLTLTIRDLDTLNQMGKGIEYFLNQIPTTQELALFFTVALQGSNLGVGYDFIDDCYEEGRRFQDLLEIIPLLLEKVGLITNPSLEEKVTEASSFSFEELIQYHLNRISQYGLTEEQFYRLTVGEIKRLAESYHLEEKEHFKRQAEMDYIQSNLIASNVSTIFSNKNKILSFEEVYGHLFTEDEIEKMKTSREEQRQERTRQELEANMLSWVEMMNAKIKTQTEDTE